MKNVKQDLKAFRYGYNRSDNKLKLAVVNNAILLLITAGLVGLAYVQYSPETAAVISMCLVTGYVIGNYAALITYKLLKIRGENKC